MFGSNYFGQPYFGQGWAGLLGIQFDATSIVPFFLGI